MNLQPRSALFSNLRDLIPTNWNPVRKRHSRKHKKSYVSSVAALESLEDRVLLAGTASGVGKKQTHIVLPKAKNDNVTMRSNATPGIIRGNILRNDKLGNPKAKLNYVISKGKKYKINGNRVIQGKYGTLRIQKNGRFVYRLKKNLAVIKNLDRGERKLDNFQYQIKGKCGRSNARLRVRILGVEQQQPPVAVDDAYIFYIEDTIPPLTVLINDSDPNNDPLTIVSIDLTGTAGTAVANPDGTITYTPPGAIPFPTFVDTFKYTITDGNGGFSTATVTITITFII